MACEFVKQVHLTTARKMLAEGGSRDAIIQHFKNVLCDQDEITLLLQEMDGDKPSLATL